MKNNYRHLLLLLFVTSFVSNTVLHADDWPQWRGPNRDGVWHESGMIEKFNGPQITLRWRTKIGPGYSGPTVADGRVYITDRLAEPKEIERVRCFEWKTGESIWTHEYACVYKGVSYPAGPRASVLVSDGRAYSLGTMGYLLCLDAVKGEVLWQKDLNREYDIQMPVWSITGSPLIEDDLLIVPVSGKEDACLVAFDCVTGQERWRALPDGANYAAPIVIEQADQRVLVYWTARRVVGLDPANGTLLWEYPLAPKSTPLGVSTPVWFRDLLFVTGFYDGCALLRVPADRVTVQQVWRRRGQNEIKTDGLHCMISTPILEGEHIYGVDSYGQLRCLRVSDGERVWADDTAVPRARWSTIHLVKQRDRIWMFNERGELIIAKLSPAGFDEVSRAMLIKPTTAQLSQRGGVCWSHPAFAYRHVFARNDEELVCANLAAAKDGQ